MEQAGRSVTNLISEINGAARQAEAKCTDIHALKYFTALKTLAFYIICEQVEISRVKQSLKNVVKNCRPRDGTWPFELFKINIVKKSYE